MEIQEIIRRWQAGVGPREIASGTGLSRNTVRKYLAAANVGANSSSPPFYFAKHSAIRRPAVAPAQPAATSSPPGQRLL